MTSSSVPDGVKLLTVSELTRAVKGLIEDGFPTVWATGEVSNISRPSSGHIYLALKDADSQLRTVIWRSAVVRLRFNPCEGQEVIARGRLSVYAPRGEYQLVVEELHPKGLGALELALRIVQHQLGHSNIGTSMGYITTQDAETIAAVEKITPLTDRKVVALRPDAETAALPLPSTATNDPATDKSA